MPKDPKSQVMLLASGHTVALEAAAPEDDKKLRKFAIEAYTGGPMPMYWSEYPVIVDLAGMQVSEKARPILRDHNIGSIVGHTTKVTNTGKALKVEGVVSAANEVAREITESSDNGYPWQASIGALILARTHVPAGQSIKVNGRNFKGPLTVVTRSQLQEVSFVALGADDNTAARMVAHAPNQSEISQMTLEEFVLAATGGDVAALTDDQRNTLKAAYDAQHSAPAPKPVDPTPVVDPVQQMRASAAAEAQRIATIHKVTEGHPDIAAKAIADGWTGEKAELESVRASRPQTPAAGGTPAYTTSTEVLEAAARESLGTPRSVLEKDYDEKILDASHRAFRGRAGLHDILMAAARANGYDGLSVRSDLRGVLKAAFALQAGGLSTIDVSGILSNIANKSLLESFYAVENVWEMMSAISPVSDFKTVTRYRLTGSDIYEKVAPGGELKHGTLGEESYTNKADTYGKLFGISRTDIINDDLGALQAVPRKLGRGAGLKLNSIFWAEWLDDAAFFNTDGSKNNYISGSTTVLSIAGLTQAVTKFRRQTDADSVRLGIEPRILLVPPELEATALEITRSVTVNSGGSSATAQIPNANIYGGRFQVLVSAYLTNTTAWYLLADPRDLAAIETVFLNGQRAPTVETADADFNTLGVQMRGYHDFGVSKQDYRGGVKSKGAA